MEKKMCEQCHTEKDIELFRKVTNQYTGVHPMSICKECYKSNQEAQQQKQAAEWEARKAMPKVRPVDWPTLKELEEHKRQLEQEHLAHQQAVEAWDREQPRRRCLDCKQEFPASVFIPWISIEDLATFQPTYFRQRCNACHEEYRKRNRQVNPICPMCSTPVPTNGGFLHQHRGYHLDLIKVCCYTCVPRFEALPEREQLERLRRAMVKAYGETAVIYALQYDEQFPCQHIGRTKHYDRRMAEYKQRGRREIKRHFILQQLSFGPLSMEYESRWMMHALKHRWPIDNFELLRGGEDERSGQRQQARLTEVVQSFEPLTAPFEVVGPLVREYFINTWDTDIVNWYCSQYDCHAYPSEHEMEQRLALMERLHGLKI